MIVNNGCVRMFCDFQISFWEKFLKNLYISYVLDTIHVTEFEACNILGAGYSKLPYKSMDGA